MAFVVANEDRFASQQLATLAGVESDFWAVLIAGMSLVVGVVALVLSGRAVHHAQTSNSIAEKALEIQNLGEQRRAEFRDVRWHLSLERRAPSIAPIFTLQNVGTTGAHGVTMVFRVRGADQSHYYEHVPAGGSVQAVPTLRSGVERLKTLVELNEAGVRVHWTSGAGEPGEWRSLTY